MSVSRREDCARLDGFELEVFKLVREHATSAQWGEWLRAPLEHAAAVGNMDLFTRLMDAGADGSASWWDCNGRTLLGAAAHGKSAEMVMALIKAGHDVNVKFGVRRESALHVAAKRGAENSCNGLMLAGVDPNVLKSGNESPLHLAAEAGRDGVVSILLQNGADPNARDVQDQTPLHLAAAGGHVLCVSKLLVGGAVKGLPDLEGCSPLHLAALHNRLGAVEELVAAGASFDVRMTQSYPEYSALDLAAREGHLDVMIALMAHGSSVEASGDFGHTALHCAARANGSVRDNGDAVRLLVQAGADIEAQGIDGFTPLHVAVSRGIGSSGTIRALLESGADVHPQGACTPLHEACFASCVDGVETLLGWGADEKLMDIEGKTAGDHVGHWKKGEGSLEHGDEEEERTAEDERIRHMLAHAPADRSWRRRGWLVLARSCPTKVQLTAVEGVSDGSSGGSSAKAAKAVHGGGDSSGDEAADLARLVGRVVGLDVEGVFRLVVGFL